MNAKLWEMVASHLAGRPVTAPPDADPEQMEVSLCATAMSQRDSVMYSEGSARRAEAAATEAEEARRKAEAELARIKGAIRKAAAVLGLPTDDPVWVVYTMLGRALLSPTVPTRPDLSPSKSPPPSWDSGGGETP